MSSPKIRFQADKRDTAFWLDLVVNPTFIKGLDAALLQFNQTHPSTENMEMAASRFQQIAGAREFCRVLLTLGEAVKEKERMPSDNLNQPR